MARTIPGLQLKVNMRKSVSNGLRGGGRTIVFSASTQKWKFFDVQLQNYLFSTSSNFVKTSQKVITIEQMCFPFEHPRNFFKNIRLHFNSLSNIATSCFELLDLRYNVYKLREGLVTDNNISLYKTNGTIMLNPTKF